MDAISLSSVACASARCEMRSIRVAKTARSRAIARSTSAIESFGGGGGMDIFSDIWVFDMAAKEWIEVSTRA